MPRSRSLTALIRLPALARSGKGPAAQRYLRERTKAVAREGFSEVTPRRRRDGIRELRVTSMQRPRRDRCSRETYVPCLRLSGRWLEQNGFVVQVRVFVKGDPGRLIITIDDPA
jgi:hypothetical protein